MVDFKDLVGKFIVIGVLVLAMFMFIIQIQDDNDATSKLEDEAIFNESVSALADTIDDSSEAATEKYDVFNSEEPKPGFGSIVLFAIVSVGKTFSNIVFGIFAVVIKLPLQVLGIPASVVSMLATWMIILVIITLWLVYKLGG